MEAPIQVRAPVRVDLAGGGTDCPPYCLDHGGAVVNCTVQVYARARLERGAPGGEAVIRSEDFDAELRAPRASELPLDGRLDLLAGMVRRMDPPFGFTLTVSSEAPPGSGLGSSGAVGVAVMRALERAMGRERSPADTAAMANQVERVDLGMAGGSQDSYGPALGGFNLLTYTAGETGTAHRRLDLASETLAELERRTVLVYTGHSHVSSDIHLDIRRSYALPDSPTVAAMHGLKQDALDMADALEAGDLEACASVLSSNWKHHQQLHPSCTNGRLQAFYEAAEGLASGGKTCGAGGGGCIVFIAQEGKREALEQACLELDGQLMPSAFEMQGAG